MSDSTTAARPVSPVRLALASLVGTTLEWYDFLVYGTIAALVFGGLFFPEFSPLAGTLASFATLAVGFAARPLGSIIFGHFGDRLGRRKMLVITLSIMGVTTFLIGVLPTYDTIGIAAPVLLIVLRVVQGLGLGGEWGGAALMAVEHAPPRRRVLFGSSTQMGSPAGQLVSTAVVAIASAATGDAFATWGWRIPFLASAVLVVFGLVIRTKLPESPEFRRVDAQNAKVRVPLAEVLRTQPATVALVAGIGGANNIAYWMSIVFTLSYATTQLGQSQDTMLSLLVVMAAIYLCAIPFMAMIADRVGPRRVIMTVALAGAVLSFPYFLVIDTGNTWLIFGAIVVMGAFVNGAIYTPQPAFFASLFPPSVRYTGASVSYALPTMLIGGTAPFIGTALYAWAHSTWPISLYMLVLCLISFGCAYLTKRLPSYLPTASESPVTAEAAVER